jgi:hypothetical protein
MRNNCILFCFGSTGWENELDKLAKIIGFASISYVSYSFPLDQTSSHLVTFGWGVFKGEGVVNNMQHCCIFTVFYGCPRGENESDKLAKITGLAIFHYVSGIS